MFGLKFNGGLVAATTSSNLESLSTPTRKTFLFYCTVLVCSMIQFIASIIQETLTHMSGASDQARSLLLVNLPDSPDSPAGLQAVNFFPCDQ